jgi:flagellar hook-basal body complex protein FliE
MATTAFAAGTYAAAQNFLSSARPSGPAGGLTEAANAASPDFGAMLKTAIDGVAQAGKTAETQAISAVGGKGDIVDVVTAVAESETALQTLVSVRDRVISAYEEIMRMQI